MRLDTAVDRFCELADDRRLGIEGVHVVLDDGRCVERRCIVDIRRDVFSVSKRVTSLAIGMLEHDGLLALDDSVLSHLPELADTAVTGAEAMTVRHLLSMTAGNGYRWLNSDADHPGVRFDSVVIGTPSCRWMPTHTRVSSQNVGRSVPSGLEIMRQRRTGSEKTASA